MSTKKPRFLVTIDPENYKALKHLAVMRGRSVSALINDMLKPSLGPLMALVRATQDPAQTDLVDYLEGVKSKVGATLEEVSASALKRGRRASSTAGGSSGSRHTPGASVTPASPAGEARPGCVSIPRSAKPGRASEALSGATLTPSSNTGVTKSRSGGNQRVSKPGRKGSSR